MAIMEEQNENEIIQNFNSSVTRGYLTYDKSQLRENIKTFKHYDGRIKSFLSNFEIKGLAVISILIALVSVISLSIIPVIISGVIVISCETVNIGRNIHNRILMHKELKKHNKFLLSVRKRQNLIKRVADISVGINETDKLPFDNGGFQEKKGLISNIKDLFLKTMSNVDPTEIDRTPIDNEYTDSIRSFVADTEPEKTIDVSRTTIDVPLTTISLEPEVLGEKPKTRRQRKKTING